MEQSIKDGADPVVVACVGDSITEGIGATRADQYSYPAQLQGLLGEGYAVHNYGASGMTLLAEGDYPYIRQERYAASLACPCDAVILMLGTNDSKPQNWRLQERYLSELMWRLRPSCSKALTASPTAWSAGRSSLCRKRLPGIQAAA